ncbi:MAG: UTP-glucose-1-phosphate uridylyltransferase [Bradyrhizobium sp. DFCI-1]|nr:MAG: UTP-glucose-1-phosphate uridylyltransferase [Bradyrhizobium sp. DFCI-1]
MCITHPPLFSAAKTVTKVRLDFVPPSHPFFKASDNPMKIRKAVFPVAGLGTRVLPATKAMPKEMLTIVDKPLIQYVVDEAREAGIEHFVFVTGRNKGVIEDHFDRMFELDTTLAQRGKKTEQEILAQNQPEAGAMSFTRQQSPLGLGHAVWCARDIVGNEPFAVVLPDELVLNTPGCLKQMIDAANKLGEKSNVIAVEAVPDELTHQYGICGVGKRTGNIFEVDGMVEKPPQGTAPSNLSITGRYILQPEIFDILATQERGAGGEIQLTDAMIGLARTQKFYGVEFEGERHDCGSKPGFLRANIAFGLKRPELRDGLIAEMKKYLEK